MKKFIKTINVVVVLLLMDAAKAQAVQYTENYETSPGGTGYAALLGSPNGLVYDTYDARALSRLAGYPITVIGSGDENFYWGNNTIMPKPLYGEPGVSYCDDNSTGYLFNGYGTGYGSTGKGNNYVLGIDFTNGPTTVYSVDIGYASGSNAPTHSVNVIGLNGGAVVWTTPGGVSYGSLTTVDLPVAAVDRIEIVRTGNTTALFSSFPSAWYTLDNLTYDIAAAPTGMYSWKYYDATTFGSGTPVPEPSAVLLMGIGVAGIRYAKRRKAQSVA
jgi:hypothetical protein